MKTTTQRKAILLSLILSIIFFNSCYYSSNGSGRIEKQVRNVGHFSGINVTSGIDIYLSQGSEASVTIRADEDIIDDVETEVIHDELRLSVDRKWFRFNHVEAYITFVEINKLDVNAGSDVKSEHPLHFDDLDLEISSGSDVNINLDANQLHMRASSGSDARLEGTIVNFYAKASSGSDINAYDLKTENAELDCSSGSDVRIWVTGSLTIDASSGSDIYYRGNPQVENISTSSGSDVHRK